jgi:hypothetical protein
LELADEAALDILEEVENSEQLLGLEERREEEQTGVQRDLEAERWKEEVEVVENREEAVSRWQRRIKAAGSVGVWFW